uniref:Uncharacterized protein n=1 Tax=Salix viminalis TaxID=40686 RepID=A0A6N2KUB7_SALVM
MLEEVCTFFYLASSTVTVTWFTENDSSCLLDEESVSKGLLPRQYPGVLGCGIVAVSLLNISTAEDIVGCLGEGISVSLLNIKTTANMDGLFMGSSSTHSRPIPSYNLTTTVKNGNRHRKRHTKKKRVQAFVWQKKNCGKPFGLILDEKSPIPGSSSDLHDVRNRSIPNFRSSPIFIPGSRVFVG